MAGSTASEHGGALVRLLREKSEIGLEMESLRVTPEGFLAHTPHPFGDNPIFDRDFCENQVEIITPVRIGAHEACRTLGDYRREARELLAALPSGKELLWPFSNPPICLGEDDVPIAVFPPEEDEKNKYREYLSKKYGRKLMLLSGIHYNFSYPPEALALLEAGWEGVPGRSRTRIYLDLAEMAAQYSWLIVALTAASPITDGSFWSDAVGAVHGTPGKTGFGSVRCSEAGYWNHFIPVLAYESIDAHIASILRYIESGDLQSPRELYYPIRLKPNGVYDIERLREGVGHIEFRMLDVNPLAPCGGLNPVDLEFFQLFIAWMTLQPRLRLSDEQQRAVVRNVQAAAHDPLEEVQIELPFGEETVRAPLVEAALAVLESMEDVFGSDPLIAFQRQKLLDPESRYTAIIRELCGKDGEDFIAAGLALAEGAEPVRN